MTTITGKEASAETISEPVYLELFVVRGAPNSELAIANLKRLCDQLSALGWKVETELVDATKVPERLLQCRVIVTPTLIRRAPEPETRVIGNLTDIERAARALGLVERMDV